MVDYSGHSFQETLHIPQEFLFAWYRQSVFCQRLFVDLLRNDRAFFWDHAAEFHAFWSHLTPEAWSISSAWTVEKFLEEATNGNNEPSEKPTCFHDVIRNFQEALQQFRQLSLFHSQALDLQRLDQSEQKEQYLQWMQKRRAQDSALLFLAVDLRLTLLLKLYIELGCSFACVSRKGDSLLHVAARNGDIPVLERLLALGVRLPQKNLKGNSPLHNAVQSGSTETMQFLLEHGADPLSFNVCSESPLLLAVRCGCVSFVEYVVGVRSLHSPGVLQHANSAGQGLLHYAAIYNQWRIAELLIQLAFHPNAPDACGNTPIHLAIENKSFAVLERLLKGKGDADRKNILKKSPLHVAVEFGWHEVFWDLFRYGAHVDSKDRLGMTPLHLAVVKGNLEAVQLLLQAKANPHTKNVAMHTALHLAVEAEHEEIIRHLLQEFPKLVAEGDFLLQSPLHLACFLGKAELVKVFFEVLPKKLLLHVLKMIDANGRNLLHASVLSERADLVEKLLGYSTLQKLINRQDYEGVSPLHLSVRMGHTDCFDVLWKLGAQIDITDKRKQTPLHDACQNARATMVQKIIEAKPSSLLQKTDLDETCLHIVAKYNALSCTRILLKKKGEILINAIDIQGQTALHLSAKNGNHEIVQLLLDQKGIDIHIKTQSGHDARSMADSAGFHEIVNLFDTFLEKT